MKRKSVETAIEIFLVFMLIVSVCGCSITLITPAESTHAATDVSETDSPSAQTTTLAEPKPSGMLFWEATDPYGPGKLYLLGSIHVADTEIYPFPDIIMSAFDSSDSLAVEVDIIAFESDISMMLNTMKLMYYPDMSKISDHMPSELYSRAKRYLGDAGNYSVVYDSMIPIFWSNIIDAVNIEKSGLSPKYGVDRFFL